MANNNHDDDDHDVVEVYTLDEILLIGLRAVNFTKRQIKKGKKQNVQRFTSHFGAKPCVVARIWEDLQTTDIEEAYVPPDSLNLTYFLMAMHAMRCYPKEREREPLFGGLD
jgi:hypothetical protein